MNIVINSSDEYGFEQKNIYEVKKKKNDNMIIYEYSDENGYNVIVFSKEQLKIERKGEINSTLIINKKFKTAFYYDTLYLKKTFEVLTETAELEENGFCFSYKIYDGNELINKLKVDISFLSK